MNSLDQAQNEKGHIHDHHITHFGNLVFISYLGWLTAAALAVVMVFPQIHFA